MNSTKIKFSYSFLGIVFVFSSLMSFKIVSQDIIKSLQATFIFMIIVFFASKNFSLKVSDLVLKRTVWLFFIIPWFSIIPAFVSHGQKPSESSMVLIVETGVFLLYFALIKNKVSEKTIIYSFTIFSLIYTFFELFQQMTYPSYWFAGRDGSEVTGQLEIRQGLYKFYMTGIHILIIPIFYYWEQLLKKGKTIFLFVLFVLIVGLYAFLARKMMIALVGTILISLFLDVKVKWHYWFFLILLGVIIVVNLDIWFYDYVNRTKEDIGEGSNWVRRQSTIFFLNYFDDPACLILGNGREYSTSIYGKYIYKLKESFGFHRNDTGIYGYFNYFGIIGLIPIIYFIKVIIQKWKNVPFYIKLYLIFHSFQITIAFPLNSINGSFVFVIAIYLIEMNIKKNNMLKRKFVPANIN